MIELAGFLSFWIIYFFITNSTLIYKHLGTY